MADRTSNDRRHLLPLVIGALGVVYGDIGTSPLYALRECFHGTHGIEPTRANVLGVLSLIFWSLVLIISIKYLVFVLRADNGGEGGILALLTLAFPIRDLSRATRFVRTMIVIGVFGTALLYGDGMITPAISVLSAIEGLNVATPFFEPYIIPITVVILIGLFSVQRFGTGRVGNVFGRVTFVWFVVLAVLGLKGIASAPGILRAVNPIHGARFFLENGWHGFVVLGAVFLVVTGGEALYADLGHFGRQAIQRAWFYVALPALLLNYFGQGALLFGTPSAAANPFYMLAPKWSLYPLVVLATAATVIASQALISGVFSLTMHAVQLGYFPRLRIEHTSASKKGQIYIPQVNWSLMLACIGLVIGFRSSSGLAAAYGIAVTMTMVVTTMLFYVTTVRVWKWKKRVALAVCLPFLIIELSFFGSNALKIAHGGWFPLVVGGIIFTLFTTWKTGRQLLRERLERSTIPLAEFLPTISASAASKVAGTAVYLSGNPVTAPPSFLHNLKHNKVIHERVVFLTIVSHDQPRIEEDKRVESRLLEPGFHQVIGHFGYMEEPDVPALLIKGSSFGLDIDPRRCSYFLSKETLIPRSTPGGMSTWRDTLFAVMSRNATSAASFFKLPANQVVELGMQIEI